MGISYRSERLLFKACLKTAHNSTPSTSTTRNVILRCLWVIAVFRTRLAMKPTHPIRTALPDRLARMKNVFEHGLKQANTRVTYSVFKAPKACFTSVHPKWEANEGRGRERAMRASERAAGGQAGK
ncbi:hypothetical protein DPMN_194678 [Dreissena polymorpha]|uniref:Uncharacterized protein n=1 Tax=Dreissena polymorpha TaxID=45954 RepID=A0A9D3XYH4_DREPO|nr:hypothetical protein DPMN_194678 [Dreissena polymorpha]